LRRILVVSAVVVAFAVGILTTAFVHQSSAPTAAPSATCNPQYVKPMQGYWLTTSRGWVYAFGSAHLYSGPRLHGGAYFAPPRTPISVIVSTAGNVCTAGLGYWLVTERGWVYPFGNAKRLHSYNNHNPGQGVAYYRPPRTPVDAMTTTPNAGGYWLATQRGWVYPFGDARLYGAGVAYFKHPKSPIIAMNGTPSGHGYMMVTSRGWVYIFGDAKSHGSPYFKYPKSPISGVAMTKSGKGYLMVTSKGWVYHFGDAPFYGNVYGKPRSPVTGIFLTSTGKGYYIVTKAGWVYGLGDAKGKVYGTAYGRSRSPVSSGSGKGGGSPNAMGAGTPTETISKALRTPGLTFPKSYQNKMAGTQLP
jgi:hypothetical protein